MREQEMVARFQLQRNISQNMVLLIIEQLHLHLHDLVMDIQLQ